MTFETQFLLFVLFILVGFAFFILFLLKLRKKTLAENLHLKSADVWQFIKTKALSYGLDSDELIYGIKRLLSTEGQEYTISHLLSWNQQIILQKKDEKDILAKYLKTNWLGKHKIEIPNYGALVSSRVSFDGRSRYSYSHNGKIVGMVEMTLDGYRIGRVGLLPASLPIEIKLFILTR